MWQTVQYLCYNSSKASERRKELSKSNDQRWISLYNTKTLYNSLSKTGCFLCSVSEARQDNNYNSPTKTNDQVFLLFFQMKPNLINLNFHQSYLKETPSDKHNRVFLVLSFHSKVRQQLLNDPLCLDDALDSLLLVASMHMILQAK